MVEVVAGDRHAPNKTHVVVNGLTHGANERGPGALYLDIAPLMGVGAYEDVVFHVLYADWDVVRFADEVRGLVDQTAGLPHHVDPWYGWNVKPINPYVGSSWVYSDAHSPEAIAWSQMCAEVALHVQAAGGSVPLVLSAHSKNRGPGTHVNVHGVHETQFARYIRSVGEGTGETFTTLNLESGFVPVEGVPGVFRHPLVDSLTNGRRRVSDGAIALHYFPNATFVEIETVEQRFRTPDVLASEMCVDVCCEMEELTLQSAEAAFDLLQLSDPASSEFRFLELAAALTGYKDPRQRVATPVKTLRSIGSEQTAGQLGIRFGWALRPALLASLYHLELYRTGRDNNAELRSLFSQLWNSMASAERILGEQTSRKPRPVGEQMERTRVMTLGAIDLAQTLGPELRLAPSPGQITSRSRSVTGLDLLSLRV